MKLKWLKVWNSIYFVYIFVVNKLGANWECYFLLCFIGKSVVYFVVFVSIAFSFFLGDFFFVKSELEFVKEKKWIQAEIIKNIKLIWAQDEMLVSRFFNIF